MTSDAVSSVTIHHVSREFAIEDLDNDAWRSAAEVAIENYWSGEKAPAGRHFTAKLLWSDTALYVQFDASQSEPFIVSDKPDVTQKTKGLWNRDVCEIFVAPDASQRNTYFEFEIAPTGEWIDLKIENASQKRKTDLDYISGMTSAAKIEKGRVVMAIKIPWSAFSMRPKAGDVWLGNLLRCVGKDPTRGYLSWQATKTEAPSFHVPEAFGEFRLTD